MSTHHSGGEVGMVPMVILLASIISFLVSLIIISVINHCRSMNILKSVLIYNFVYFIVMMIFGLNPADGNGFYENADLFTVFIAFISMILTLILSKVFENYYNNIS